MINIEMVSLGALEQHHLVRVESVIQHPAYVSNVGLDPISVEEQVFGDLDRVDFAPVVDLDEEVVLLLQRCLDLLPQDRRVE
jgi:hypothetical protein